MPIFLSGCHVVTKTEDGRSPVTFAFVEDADIPKELKQEIELRKEEPFQLTFGDMEYLYIAEGYGKKECSEYCIELINCSETEDVIYIEATLHGPGSEGEVCETEYAYYVIRIAYTEKMVVFEG